MTTNWVNSVGTSIQEDNFELELQNIHKIDEEHARNLINYSNLIINNEDTVAIAPSGKCWFVQSLSTKISHKGITCHNLFH